MSSTTTPWPRPTARFGLVINHAIPSTLPPPQPFCVATGCGAGDADLPLKTLRIECSRSGRCGGHRSDSSNSYREDRIRFLSASTAITTNVPSTIRLTVPSV